jgi:hypothetical protein
VTKTNPKISTTTGNVSFSLFNFLSEAHFGLSTRAAQMTTARLGLAVFLGISPFVVRKTKAILDRIIAAAAERSWDELDAVRQWADKIRPRHWGGGAGVTLRATFSSLF